MYSQLPFVLFYPSYFTSDLPLPPPFFFFFDTIIFFQLQAVALRFHWARNMAYSIILCYWIIKTTSCNIQMLWPLIVRRVLTLVKRNIVGLETMKRRGRKKERGEGGGLSFPPLWVKVTRRRSIKKCKQALDFWGAKLNKFCKIKNS